MNNHGFSLIECMVYCSILMILSVMTFTFIARITTTISQSNSRMQQALWLEAAHELLRADIQQASCNVNEWCVQEKNQFVCKGAQEWYGWRLKGENLYRMKGIYDCNAQQWLEKSESLVARHVQLFKPVVHIEKELVKAVHCTLALRHSSRVEETVHVMNGVCL